MAGSTSARCSGGTPLAAGPRELAAVQPCHLVIFDALEVAGADQRPLALSARRRRLEELFEDIEQPSALALGMQTADLATAQVWFDQMWDVVI